MGNQAFGWADDKKVVLDPELLNEAASRLKQQNGGDLVNQLANALAPPGAFGQIEGGTAAALRLGDFLTALQGELTKVGLDINDLAARTLAARQMAVQANADTTRAAHGANPNGGQ